MNTTKKSSLENPPYQHARTSISEPKPRRSRSASSKEAIGSLSSSSTRTISTSDSYSPRSSSRGKSGSTKRSAVRSLTGSDDSITPRSPRRSTRSSSSLSESKAPRRTTRIRSSAPSNEPTRSLEEDAEILRRFKSLMQQGGDNTNSPVVSDPYPKYQVDEIGTVIHQKGANRPKSEVKVVVRRKRTLQNDSEGYDYEDEESLDNADAIEDNNDFEQDTLVAQDASDSNRQADNSEKSNDYLLKAAALAFGDNFQEEPKKSKTSSKKTASSSNLKGDYDSEEIKTPIENQSLSNSNNGTNSNIDDNLLRAAAIVFAQDPVMGVSKEQSLALGITSHVAEAILQESIPGKKKKKKNKLTPAQKAEAEAQAAAIAAQEAAAIVALSKRFSGRKISQAESSLKAMSSYNNELDTQANKNSSLPNSSRALMNKLAKTQAQLEKDDILPDSFDMSENSALDESQFTKAATEEYADSPITNKVSYSSHSVADIDHEFKNDDQVLAQKATKAKTTIKSQGLKAKENNTVVETNSTILNGANDTSITIEVKRRKSTTSSKKKV